MSKTLPKRSLRDFLSLRHPNHLILATDSSRPLFKQIEILSGILTVYFNCKYICANYSSASSGFRLLGEINSGAIILVQDFCPRKIKITQCPGGFCVNMSRHMFLQSAFQFGFLSSKACLFPLESSLEFVIHRGSPNLLVCRLNCPPIDLSYSSVLRPEVNLQ